MQTPNIILKQRKTSYDIAELEKQLKYIFDNNYKKKIKQVILFDEENNLIVYYKNKKVPRQANAQRGTSNVITITFYYILRIKSNFMRYLSSNSTIW